MSCQVSRRGDLDLLYPAACLSRALPSRHERLSGMTSGAAVSRSHSLWNQDLSYCVPKINF